MLFFYVNSSQVCLCLYVLAVLNIDILHVTCIEFVAEAFHIRTRTKTIVDHAYFSNTGSSLPSRYGATGFTSSPSVYDCRLPSRKAQKHYKETSEYCRVLMV